MTKVSGDSWRKTSARRSNIISKTFRDIPGQALFERLRPPPFGIYGIWIAQRLLNFRPHPAVRRPFSRDQPPDPEFQTRQQPDQVRFDGGAEFSELYRLLLPQQQLGALAGDPFHPDLPQLSRLRHQRLGRADDAVVVALRNLDLVHPLIWSISQGPDSGRRSVLFLTAQFAALVSPSPLEAGLVCS